MRRYIGLIIGTMVLVLGMQAQVSTRILNPHIKTLKVELLADANAIGGRIRVERPFLVLKDGIVDGSDEENCLLISFDEMSHDVKMYSYRVQMMDCSASTKDGLMKWNENLLNSEYLQGFTTGDINDYEHSVNTTREYTHYRFRFPNEDMQLTKSGYYRLSIYEDNNRDKVIGEVDFVVTEALAQIVSSIRYDTQIETNGRFQQLEIETDVSALGVRDPNEFRIVVTQNNRTDNPVLLTQPTYIQGNRLRYVNKRELIFEGGNEYRHFDNYSTYLAGTNIDRIAFFNNDYHALLMPDELHESGEQYIHEFDANGQYLVNAERTNDPETEAEYMWVHWELPVKAPWLDGAVYVGGDLFENRMSSANRMEYDEAHRCYYLNALVKQGGYDYQYWFVPKIPQVPSTNGSSPVTTQRTEGSYWQTENEYAIYVYYRPFGARYDRLIGLQIQKSAL